MAGIVCALVIGFYCWRTSLELSELGDAKASEAYYNLLVEGFRHGQLSLGLSAPEGLKRLADPYDPAANFPFRKDPFAEGRVHDMSYYKGRLYLYFSPVPALLLFWPYRALTGGYMRHNVAVAIFSSVGLLVATGLICAAWRRYFPRVHGGTIAACVFALGLASGVPVMMFRPDLWEVPISCAYALTMLALAAIWCGLHDPGRRCRWAMAASIAYALAIASRPSVLFGSLILTIPLFDSWRDSVATAKARLSRVTSVLCAMAIPLILIGACVALYNYLRFGDLMEFGQRYQLAADRQDAVQHFNWRFLWFNFRLYFFSFASWDWNFPFIRDVVVPPLPSGHGDVDRPYGILTNTPITLFALAVPILWHGAARRPYALSMFVVAATLTFVTSALMLCLFYGTCTRYIVEFTPELMVLACIGLLVSLDAAPTHWSRVGLLTLAFVLLVPSVGFGILKSFQGRLERFLLRGSSMEAAGRVSESIALYEEVARAKPAWFIAQFCLARAYENLRRLPEAIDHYETALRLSPNDSATHNNIGNLYLQTGRLTEAMEHFRHAVRQRPDLPQAHKGIGVVLLLQKLPAEAAQEFETALRFAPDNAEAHFDYGIALLELRRAQEAIPHFEEALRLQPALPGARDSLETARQRAKTIPKD